MKANRITDLTMIRKNIDIDKRRILFKEFFGHSLSTSLLLGYFAIEPSIIESTSYTREQED